MDLTSKLDILFKQNLYSLALSIASADNNSVVAQEDISKGGQQKRKDKNSDAIVKEIHKRYGDWLYSKADYDAAMIQYQQTVGYLEPSYVIRKFLDAERLHNLTSFLQVLHEVDGGRLATSDHTTLLINCYTKLKDNRRLDEFLKREEVTFDADTAIRVCRTAGYFQHALWLAERFNNHDQYLQVQTENCLNFADAVAYVARLPHADQARELRRYGPALVREMAAEMTDLLVRVCAPAAASAAPVVPIVTVSSGQGGGAAAAVVEATASADGLAAAPSALYPEEFLHLFVGRSEWCIVFLERVLELRWGISGAKGKRPASLDTGVAGGGHGRAGSGGRAGTGTEEGTGLEPREEESLRTVCNSLLELYLEDIAAAVFDVDQALILCQLQQFDDGILYLLQKLNKYDQMMRFYMDREKYGDIIAVCKRYGDDDKSLWAQALTYFSGKVAGGSDGHGGHDASQELAEVLDLVDARSIMPPLEVIQVVSKNSGVTVGTVRHYLVRHMQAEQRAIDEARKLSESYRQETARMRAQVAELRTTAVVFQASKCALCGLPLELPTVHFMCRHSFHARCVGGGGPGGADAAVAAGGGSASPGAVAGAAQERECPRCAPEYQMVLETLQSQAEAASRMDLLKKKKDAPPADAAAADAAAATAKQPAKKPRAALEEDDEFEDFPADK
ncbi:Vacuolar protein sorting-associated protein 11, partial [Cladochytrium tenue]